MPSKTMKILGATQVLLKIRQTSSCCSAGQHPAILLPPLWTQVLVHYNAQFTPSITKFSTAIIYQKKDEGIPAHIHPTFNISTDSEVIFIDAKKNRIKMTYGQIQEKVDDRHLVRVVKTKTTETIPEFRIMSDVDLEVALRKQRAEAGLMKSREILVIDNGRVKQKSINIGSKISEYDFSVHIKKIEQWLEKGHFVRVNVKKVKGGQEGQELVMEKKILAHFGNRPELLGRSNAKLKFRHLG